MWQPLASSYGFSCLSTRSLLPKLMLLGLSYVVVTLLLAVIAVAVATLYIHYYPCCCRIIINFAAE
jgi:hypothetical protein